MGNIPYRRLASVLILAVSVCHSSVATWAATGQQPQEQTDGATQRHSADHSDDSARQEQLHQKLRDGLTNVKFIGQFTITGMEEQLPKEEEYTITKVRKLEKDDFWEITARIKYGNHDVTVPMAMQIKWAGKTPVITVDQLFVPGLGTFDARVLLRKDKYAGTWAHGHIGGHLFGRIERIESGSDQSEAAADEKGENAVENSSQTDSGSEPAHDSETESGGDQQ